MAFLDALDAFEFVGRMIEGAFGWRYLLSPKYRSKVRAEWRKGSKIVVIGDALSFIISFVFFNLLDGWLIWEVCSN